MKRYKRSLFGGVIALLLGTSCCWMSALAIWIGGVAVSGLAVRLIDDAQIVFIGVGAILIIIAGYQFLIRRKLKARDDKK